MAVAYLKSMAALAITWGGRLLRAAPSAACARVLLGHYGTTRCGDRTPVLRGSLNKMNRVIYKVVLTGGKCLVHHRHLWRSAQLPLPCRWPRCGAVDNGTWWRFYMKIVMYWWKDWLFTLNIVDHILATWMLAQTHSTSTSTLPLEEEAHWSLEHLSTNLKNEHFCTLCILI